MNYMYLAAIMTWVAVVMSEWMSARGADRRAFLACAALFITAFFYCNGERKTGWSIALVAQIFSAATAVSLGGFGVTPALYVILGTQIYERLSRRDFWLVMFVINLILLFRLQHGNTWPWALSSMAAYGGFQLFGVTMAANAVALNASNLTLSQTNAELMAARALLGESARSSERLHLSRELHDVCGHKLTALKLTLRQAAADGALQGENLTLTHQLTDELLADIRAVVTQLRTHDGIDLGIALKQLAAGWPEPHVALIMTASIHVPNMDVAQALLRIAQEALTNAARHAQAKHVRLQLDQTEHALRLQISDDGRGQLPLKLGNGLQGMQERIVELDGTLTIESGAPGIVVTASIPLNFSRDSDICLPRFAQLDTRSPT